jgi:predicted porin
MSPSTKLAVYPKVLSKVAVIPDEETTIRLQEDFFMFRKVLAGGALALASVGAFAQSSVTLYGTLDEGLTYLSNVNGKQLWQMESGNLFATSFGLKGTEDLGGGMKAVFQLESGFDINSGRLSQGGLMFGRTAYVGLADDTYGTLTMGRQYDSASDILGQYSSCFLYGGSGYHFGDNDNVCQSTRFNNVVKYVSPSLAGVSVSAMIGLGNQSNFAQNRTYSVGVSYVNGGLNVGAGYLNASNVGSNAGPFDSAGVATAFNNASGDNYVGYMSGNYVGIQDADKWKVAGIGGAYTWDKAVFTVEYTNSKYEKSQYLIDAGGAGNPTTAVTFNNFELGALYNFTPAFSVNAGYTLSTLSLNAVSREDRFHIFQLLADYKLSKRTDLYALGNFQIDSGDGVYFDGTSFSKAASVQGLSTTNRQLGLSVGMRTVF